MIEPAEVELAQPAAPNPYRLFCLAALMVLAMAMLEKGMGTWSFVPLVAGGFSVLRCWRGGPMVVLLGLAVAASASSRGVDPVYLLYALLYGGGGFLGAVPMQRLDPLPDMAICAAVLAFVAGHYRLQMMDRFAFPAESLRRASLFLGSAPAAGEEPRRRKVELTSALEVGLLASTLPLWTGLAALVLFWLTQNAPQLTLIDSAWRMPALLFWALALGLALLGTLLGYQRQTNLDREESLLYLQDQLWRQTRGEQQRINRWLVWGRLRRQRRKGKS